jgi:hypothetical protein
MMVFMKRMQPKEGTVMVMVVTATTCGGSTPVLAAD